MSRSVDAIDRFVSTLLSVGFVMFIGGVAMLGGYLDLHQASAADVAFDGVRYGTTFPIDRWLFTAACWSLGISVVVCAGSFAWLRKRPSAADHVARAPMVLDTALGVALGSACVYLASRHSHRSGKGLYVVLVCAALAVAAWQLYWLTRWRSRP